MHESINFIHIYEHPPKVVHFILRYELPPMVVHFTPLYEHPTYEHPSAIDWNMMKSPAND